MIWGFEAVISSNFLKKSSFKFKSYVSRVHRKSLLNIGWRQSGDLRCPSNWLFLASIWKKFSEKIFKMINFGLFKFCKDVYISFYVCIISSLIFICQLKARTYPGLQKSMKIISWFLFLVIHSQNRLLKKIYFIGL